jgi:hypothetical protein
MRCYTKQHQFYCGIDLHARTMYACIWNHHGEIMLHRLRWEHDPSSLHDRHAIHTRETRGGWPTEDPLWEGRVPAPPGSRSSRLPDVPRTPRSAFLLSLPSHL